MKTNDPAKRAPRWQRIADAIAAEIEAGRHPAGCAMPTVADFAVHFGVNRHTVRQALLSLQGRGLVSLERGRGTFAIERNIEYRLGRRVRFSGNLAATGLDLRREILHVEKAALAETEAKRLHLHAGAQAWRFRIRALAGRDPFSLAWHLVSAERFADFPERLAATGNSISEVFAGYGLGDYVRLSTRIDARAPEGDEGRLLGLPAGIPVLFADGIDGNLRGEPIQAVATSFAAHRIRFLVEPEARLDGELA